MLAAAIVLIACGFATARFGSGLQMPATTTAGRHADHTEPLPARAGARRLCLVGSSLTFRLKEEYFATPRLRNLALAGGSPSPGWRSLRTSRALPQYHSGRGECSRRVHRCHAGRTLLARRHWSRCSFAPCGPWWPPTEQRLRAPLTHEQVALDLRQVGRAAAGRFRQPDLCGSRAAAVQCGGSDADAVSGSARNELRS